VSESKKDNQSVKSKQPLRPSTKKSTSEANSPVSVKQKDKGPMVKLEDFQNEEVLVNHRLTRIKESINSKKNEWIKTNTE